MDVAGKVAVVTGGGSGIGRAMCERFAADGAESVVVIDVRGDAAIAVAEGIGSCGRAVTADVTREADIESVVRQIEAELGRIDLFCSNAGIGGGGGIDAPDETWSQLWAVNVMAYVYAARHVLPGMLERGEGYLLQTASAAGLLTNLGNAPYSVTKHAAVGLAEWLSATYGDRGVRVSVLCPQGVRTPLLLDGMDADDPAARAVFAAGELLDPEQVADAVIEGLRDERFLILPHPQVAEFYRRKADDPDRWLRAMRRMQAQL